MPDFSQRYLGYNLPSILVEEKNLHLGDYLMLAQRQLRPVSARLWLARQRNRAMLSILFLLYVVLLSACGAAPPSATTTGQSPPAIAHPFRATVKTLDGAFMVTLAITPDHSGPNVFAVRVVDMHTGKQVTHVVIILYTTMQDMQMGTDSIMLHANRNGQFSATSDNLSMEGRWLIGMTIQTPDHIIHKAGVSLVTL